MARRKLKVSAHGRTYRGPSAPTKNRTRHLYEIIEGRITPCVEIGWRLAAKHWGLGYATEGARAVLEFGFEALRLGEVVSFTAPGNLRSRRVMEKIGMVHNPADDFDHPTLPDGHRLRRHALYRMARR